MMRTVISRPALILAFGLLFVLAGVLPGAAATPQIAWTETFGGSADDWGFAVAPTADGGYILAGSTDPSGAGVGDAYLVKIDATGRREWERTYGGAAKDAARAVVQTPDGGYVLAGETGVPPTAMDLLIIRTDASGDLVWETSVGGPDLEEGRGLCMTYDGGFVVCGDTRSYGSGGTSFYLVKVDADGQLAWQRSYSGGGDGHAYAVREAADRSLVLCGYSGNGELVPEFDSRLFKLNAGGGVVWQRTYSDSIEDWGFDLEVLSDGDIVMAGKETSFLSLRRISSTGALRWSEIYPSIRGYNAVVTASPRGGFFVAGSTYEASGGYQILLMETDGAGLRLNSQTVGGTGREYAQGIAIHPNGDLMVAGSTSSEGAGGLDMYAVAFDIGSISGTGDLPSLAEETLLASPNPFNPRVRIDFVMAAQGNAQVRIYDIRGRHVATLHDGPAVAGSNTVDWSGRDHQGRDLPTGVYLMRLETERGFATRKLSLIR